MSHDDLAFAPALEQARLVRSGAISPVELTRLYLDRIERLNPKINAFVTVAAEQAIDAARAAEKITAAEKVRDDLPPFHGVPISVKDLSDTAGIRSTHGCAAWSDRVPDTDDEVVARIRRAGFVILGKTVTPELGPVNISEPPGYPPGRNPWNPELSCGGSSGGAAAALASGLCPVSHGSDGGGSIRNPSSWCGVFGVKPSRGRISDAPDSQQFFSVQGPLARYVADAAALLDALSGPSTGDTFWAPPPKGPFVDEVGRDPGRLRVAFATRPHEPELTVHGPYVDATREAAKLLESFGHTVEEVDFPGVGSDLLASMSLAFFANYAARENELPPFETLTPWTQGLIQTGRTVTGAQYISTMDTLQSEMRRVVERFDTHDVLVSPTLALPPPKVGEFKDIEITNVMRLWALTPFTAMWNNTGQPAVSVPWGLDPEGLPIGVQIVGRPADEATLFRLAGQIEAERPWSQLRPIVS